MVSPQNEMGSERNGSMIYALHGLTVRYSNIISDIRLAKEAGYDALELHTDKLDRYMSSDLGADYLATKLEEHGIIASGIDIIGAVETQDAKAFAVILEKTKVLCEFANLIDCKTIQLNPFSELEHQTELEQIKLTARNITQICDIGFEHGIRFQLEAAAWTPIHTLDQCLNLLEAVNKPNLGLVVDFWHFWASRGATPEQIRALDSGLIYAVHISDGFRPEIGAPWVDETLLRDVLVGDGEIPIWEWVDAIKATGFDGCYSGEFLGHTLWEKDHLEIATEYLKRMKVFVNHEPNT
jgi:sugar phosphate isomerase/epimerase